MFISFKNEKPRITKDLILDCVTIEDIYRKFAKDFPKRICKRPWATDNHPSFGFFKHGGTWLWKDMAWDESGNVFSYIMRQEGVDFEGALSLIAQAFNIEARYAPPTRIQYDTHHTFKESEEEGKRLQVVVREMTNRDYDWWNRLNITPNILDMYHSGGAQELWVDEKIRWVHKEANPIYYYHNPISGNVQVYRPLEKHKNYRWRTSMNPLYDVHGYYQCRIKEFPNRPLLITKSRKDVMFFRSFGYNAMANTAETNNFYPDFIRHLKKYCFPIIYIGDNDIPGVKKGIKIKKEFNLPTLYICNKDGAKDPTDLWLKDYKRVYDLLNNVNDCIEFLRNTQSYNFSSTRLFNPRTAC